MVFIWLKGTKHEIKHRLSTHQQNMINQTLELAKRTQPIEFSRRIRPITDFSLFKATEFRTLLLYTGMVAFLKTISQKSLDIFLLSRCGIHLLSDEKQFKLNNATAKIMLQSFVVQFSDHFGKHLISFNVHNVVHLADETIIQNAPLDEFACWIFESYNSTLKYFGRKQNLYLQQAYNRTMENYRTGSFQMKNINKINPPYFTKMDKNTAVSNNKCFNEVKFKKCVINTTESNRLFITKGDKIVAFDMGVEISDKEIKLLQRVIRSRPVVNCTNYFTKPIINSSYLGIYKSTNCQYRDFKLFDVNEIATKIFCIKSVDGEYIFISMLF